MKTLDKYLNIPFFLFAFFLPIFLPASNIFLALSIIAILYRIDKEKILFNSKFFFTSTAMLFFAYLIGVIYTENVERGVNFLGRITTFVIVPFALGFKSKLNFAKIQKSLFFGLTISLFLVCLFLLINVAINYISAGDFTIRSLFSYRYTTQRFVFPLNDSHPTYFGLYILMSFTMWEFNNYKVSKGIKLMVYSVFFTSLIFLNSRIIFISSLIYILLYVYVKLKSKKQKIIALSTIFVLVVSTIYLLKETYFVKKWERGIIWDLTENIGNSNTTKKLVSDSRMARWQVAVNKILKKPIFGYGTGTEIEILREGYFENGLVFAFEEKYNAHNQYLSYLIELGIIGLLVFIFILMYNSYIAIKANNYNKLLLIMFIICISTTENLLVRNMGITFFAMFFNINKIAIINEKKLNIIKA